MEDARVGRPGAEDRSRGEEDGQGAKDQSFHRGLLVEVFRSGEAAALTRAGVAVSTLEADAIAPLRRADRIDGTGVSGPVADQGSGGKQEGQRSESESFHPDSPFQEISARDREWMHNF
jgi:hypothetical protein